MMKQYILIANRPISKSIRKVFEPRKLRPGYLGKVKGSTTRIYMVTASKADDNIMDEFKNLEPEVKIITYEEYLKQKCGES